MRKVDELFSHLHGNCNEQKILIYLILIADVKSLHFRGKVFISLSNETKIDPHLDPDKWIMSEEQIT